MSLHLNNTNDLFTRREVNKVIEFWNSKKIIKHSSRMSKQKCDKLGEVVSMAIRLHGVDKILQAIDNYSIIINDNSYYFNYKWSLMDFLLRGLTQRNSGGIKGYLMFFNENKPFEAFKKDDVDPFVELRNKFIPITEEYDTSCLLDQEKQTYFGFNLEDIRFPELKMELIDRVIMKDQGDIVKFPDFWRLELVIAALFFRRKTKPEYNRVKQYMDIWENNKKRFEK